MELITSRRFELMMIIVLLLLLAACGGGGNTIAEPAPETTTAPAGMPALGSPAALLRGVSYLPVDRAQDGRTIDVGLPSQNVTNAIEDYPDGVFAPSWDPGVSAGASDLAYAVYAFSLDGYNEAAQVSLGWGAAPAEGNLFIGVGNHASDRWDWFTSTTDDFNLGSMAHYIDGSGRVIVAVVVLGADVRYLRWVRIGENVAPVADLQADVTTGDAPLTVNFDSTGSYDPDHGMGLVHWDLDGDAVFEDSTMGPDVKQHIYDTAGTYDVKVKVGDGDGAEDEDGLTIIVNAPGNDPPIAELAATPTTGGVGTAVSFDAIASYDPDGSIARVEWDWEGDGEYDEDTGIVLTAQHTYDTDGTYNATVRVFDNLDVSDTDSVTITISDTPNIPPAAEISADVTLGDVGMTVTFDAGGSTDSDGTIDLYEWDWDGDGSWDQGSGTTAVVPHTYSTAGTFHPNVRVTDNLGATDSPRWLVVVVSAVGSYDETEDNDDNDAADELPTPGFSGFSASLGPAGYNGDDDDWFHVYLLTGYKYKIEMLDFLDDDADLDMKLFEDDGTTEVGTSTSTSDDEEITFTPTETGTYRLRCYVYNSSGSSDYTLHISTTEVVLPVAVIEAVPTSGSRVLQVDFDGGGSYSDTGDITKYEWDFDGDGHYDVTTTVGSPPAPEDSIATGYYYGTGTFKATLRVTDSEDAMDTAEVDIIVTGGADGESEPNNDDDTANTQDDADAANTLPAFGFANFYGFVGPKAAGEDPGDPDDWFKFTLTGTGEVDLYMELFDAVCDIDMRLYADGDYSTALASSAGTVDDEQITETLDAGTYYLRVYAFSSVPQSGGYRLSGTFTP